MIKTVGEMKKFLEAINDDVLIQFYGYDKEFKELEVTSEITDMELDYDPYNDKHTLYIVGGDLG